MLILTWNLEDLQQDLAIRGNTLVRAGPRVEALTNAAASFGANIGAKSTE
ncbi:hypothetical protein B0I28_11239 [Glycomyces artemisiae]|uniref:Uncharacterized protein n=1 Tax=Glycomyces artemisiae TaxID=1076443 RepID=A0A2T0UCQ8_9ACTN|nr:hypothetical protein B0I28_11239 [Glycomyces artemisiae]